MQIKNGKDFWAGLMFVGFGLWFFIVSRNYNMGSALRMGPAYFPSVLGGMLIVLGAATFLRSFFSKIENPWRLFEFRPVNFASAVVLALVAYFADRWLRETSTVLQFLVGGSAILLFFASFGKRSLWQVLMATLAFGYLLKPLGLVLASFLFVMGSGLIAAESKIKEVLILAFALAVFASLTFVVALDQPFPLWPEVVMDWYYAHR